MPAGERSPLKPGLPRARRARARPATHCRMNWMASSYFMPLSMRASATRTGALGGTGGRVARAAALHPCPGQGPAQHPRAGTKSHTARGRRVAAGKPLEGGGTPDAARLPHPRGSPTRGTRTGPAPAASSPPEAGHTVHSHTAAGVCAELGLQQAQPVVHHLAGRGRPVVKRPVLHTEAACEGSRPSGGWTGRAQASRPWAPTRSGRREPVLARAG